MKHLDQIISRIFDPVFEGPLIIWLAVKLSQQNQDFKNLGLSLLFFYLLPMIFFLFSWKKGWVSDWDTTKRRERYGVFTFAFLSIISGLVILLILGQTVLVNCYLKLLLPVIIFFITTFFWKISGHLLMNSIFFLLIYFNLDKSSIIIIASILLLLVGWSRIKLKKHTLPQVIAGALLPVVIYFWVLGFNL